MLHELHFKQEFSLNQGDIHEPGSKKPLKAPNFFPRRICVGAHKRFFYTKISHFCYTFLHAVN